MGLHLNVIHGKNNQKSLGLLTYSIKFSMLLLSFLLISGCSSHKVHIKCHRNLQQLQNPQLCSSELTSALCNPSLRCAQSALLSLLGKETCKTKRQQTGLVQEGTFEIRAVWEFHKYTLWTIWKLYVLALGRMQFKTCAVWGDEWDRETQRKPVRIPVGYFFIFLPCNIWLQG